MQVRTLVASAWNSTNWVSQQFVLVSFWHHIQQRKSLQHKLCFDENTLWKWAWLHVVDFGAMHITKQSVLLFVNYFSQGRSQRTTKFPLFFSLAFKYFVVEVTWRQRQNERLEEESNYIVQVHVLLFVYKHDEMLFLITNILEAIMEKLSSLNWNDV